MSRSRDTGFVRSKFHMSGSDITAHMAFQFAAAVVGATLLAWGWLLADREGSVGLHTVARSDAIMRVAGALLLLRAAGPWPRPYGFVALWPMQVRRGNLLASIAVALAAAVLVVRPSIVGVQTAFWLNLLLWLGCAFAIFGIYLYLRIGKRYLRKVAADYGPSTSAFLDLAMNPRVLEARFMYYYLSFPLVLAVALISWRIAPLFLWFELNRIQVLMRLMSPPFALFLTGAYEEAEADMLKLRLAAAGRTMMHLVVDRHGEAPRHPRLADDTFRIAPGAESAFRGGRLA